MIGICAALASILRSSRPAAPCCQFIIGGCFKSVLEGANKLPVPGAEKLANMPELGKEELCPDLRKIRKEPENRSRNSFER
jgi:hypothetical protein